MNAAGYGSFGAIENISDEEMKYPIDKTKIKCLWTSGFNQTGFTIYEAITSW